MFRVGGGEEGTSRLEWIASLEAPGAEALGHQRLHAALVAGEVLGREGPLAFRGTRNSIVPTRVVQVRGLEPLRYPVSPSPRSAGATPRRAFFSSSTTPAETRGSSSNSAFATSARSHLLYGLRVRLGRWHVP